MKAQYVYPFYNKLLIRLRACASPVTGTNYAKYIPVLKSQVKTIFSLRHRGIRFSQLVSAYVFAIQSLTLAFSVCSAFLRHFRFSDKRQRCKSLNWACQGRSKVLMTGDCAAYFYLVKDMTAINRVIGHAHDKCWNVCVYRICVNV